ncbi:hypothetical protein MYA_2113 [Burkholderia sp. KJ006]|nr:hypothetical protein MYA_2113 [Burkholderia sp. KJ006]
MRQAGRACAHHISEVDGAAARRATPLWRPGPVHIEHRAPQVVRTPFGANAGGKGHIVALSRNLSVTTLRMGSRAGLSCTPTRRRAGKTFRSGDG